jgi:hypothetical protein
MSRILRVFREQHPDLKDRPPHCLDFGSLASANIELAVITRVQIIYR